MLLRSWATRQASLAPPPCEGLRFQHKERRYFHRKYLLSLCCRMSACPVVGRLALPVGRFSADYLRRPTFPSSFFCLRRHTFCQQQEKWAKAHTVVSADFQPPCGVKIGTLPRNHLASSATGGASAVSTKNQWFLDFLSLQEFRSLWDVVSIDSATDPLLLPLR